VTSRFPDDTALDAIASQVRSRDPLSDAEVGALLEQARDPSAGAAKARLVEQQLGTVLDAVLARGDSGVELMDLYQEGSIAAAVAVGEYTGGAGDPDGLRTHVARVVGSFLDEVIAREAARRIADTLLLERVALLETVEVAVRRRLEREPTTLELAAALEWTPDEVEVVSAALKQARMEDDAELVEFLDDIDDRNGVGGGS
jgi:RNA polymerase primary sigma factor